MVKKYKNRGTGMEARLILFQLWSQVLHIQKIKFLKLTAS